MKMNLTICGDLDVMVRANWENSENGVDFQFSKKNFQLNYEYEAKADKISTVINGIKEITGDSLKSLLSLVEKESECSWSNGYEEGMKQQKELDATINTATSFKETDEA